MHVPSTRICKSTHTREHASGPYEEEEEVGRTHISKRLETLDSQPGKYVQSDEFFIRATPQEDRSARDTMVLANNPKDSVRQKCSERRGSNDPQVSASCSWPPA